MSIGLKVTVPWQGQTIERAVEVGDFETVHATWNLLDRVLVSRRAPGMRARCDRQRALANGQLTARGDVAELFDTA